MLARLWWKDARQFLPIWTTVALVALLNHWLFLTYLAEARRGALLAIAFGMTCLYALVVTAAAFAGERENHTLTWLDSQALPRRQLWEGKASFALVSTLALAAFLIGVAALYSGEWEPTGGDTRLQLILTCAAGLLEVLGWGLFWSALLNSALLAGALSVVCATMFVPYLFFPDNLLNYPGQALVRLLIAALTTTASALIILRGQSPHQIPVPLGRRRGIASTPAQPATLSPLEDPPRPTRSWRHAASRLGWLAFRQVRSVLWMLILLALGLPALHYLANQPVSYQNSSPLYLLLNLGVALFAGVMAFGADNVSRTYRTLANQGASPTLIWLTRNLVWLLTLALLWLPYLLIAVANDYFLRGWPTRQPLAEVLLIMGALATLFAIGQLCGMVIPRAITAALVAILAALLVAVPLSTLFSFGMLPATDPFFVAAALLLVSWAWTRDWLLDRLGPWRWASLASYLAIAGVALFIAYIDNRASSLPEIAAPSHDSALQQTLGSQPPAPDLNAAPLYQQATNRVQKVGSQRADLRAIPPRVSEILQGNDDPAIEREVTQWVEANNEALTLVREASRRPFCQFKPLAGRTLFDRATPNLDLYSLGQLISVSAQLKIKAGNLEAAWTDLMAALRVARHAAGPVTWTQAFTALELERQALGLAMQWALAPGQTPESLRQALAGYQALTSMPPFTQTIRYETTLLKQTLDMPLDRLRDELTTFREGRDGFGSPTLSQRYWAILVTTPWERTRAHRALHILEKSLLTQTERPAHQRYLARDPNGWTGFEAQFPSGPGYFRPDDFSRILETTPLINLLFPQLQNLIGIDDLNEVSRRALPIILALRGWQLEHNDRLPEQLSQLTPDWLDNLPADPFSNQPFRYVPSGGQSLIPLSSLNRQYQYNVDPPVIPTFGYRLLYSVGPDQQDQGAIRSTTATQTGDIVFPIPDHNVQRPEAPQQPPEGATAVAPDDDALPPLSKPAREPSWEDSNRPPRPISPENPSSKMVSVRFNNEGRRVAGAKSSCPFFPSERNRCHPPGHNLCFRHSSHFPSSSIY